MIRTFLPRTDGLPRAFWIIFFGWLLNRAGGFVWPFLALYLTSERHLTPEHAGAIASLFGLGMVGAGPVGGVLADRLGRRPALLFASVGGAALTLVLGWVRDPAAIAVAALFMGFFEEMYRAPGMAAVSDLVAPEHRPRAFAYMYWAANAGFATGTMTAGLLAAKGFGVLFVIDAAATAAFGALFWFGVPETRPEHSQHQTNARSLLIPYRHNAFVSFAAVSFVLGVMFQQIGSSLPMDLTAVGVSATYGALLSLNGVMIVLLQPAAIAATARFPRGRVLAAGALIVGAGLGLNAVAGANIALRATSVVIFTIGEIAMSGITPTIVSDLAPAHLRGSYQGAFQFAWGAAAATGPLLGGVLLARTGAVGLWSVCFALGVVAAAGYLVTVPERVKESVSASVV